MAHLRKQKTTGYVDAAGQRVPKGTPGAKKVTVASKKWYGVGIPGMGKKRVPLAADKSVALRMLADLVTAGERGEAGLTDRKDSAAALEPLAVEFVEGIGRKAGTSHTTSVIRNIRRVLAGCKLKTVADLRAADLAVRVEAFVWSLTEGDDAIAAPTAAYIGKHARQFTRWLWRKRKLLDSDPLAGMDLPSQDVVNKRRALTAEELAKLIQTAAESKVVFREMTGPERAILYSLAVTTGFRAAELAQLTAASFDLSADPPTVSLPGTHTKNKKDARLPVASGVARQLAPLLARRPSGPVFPGTWWDRAADMLRIDLEAAGIKGMTGDGETVFHSLRHTFITLVGQSSPLKVLQDLARHSTPILTVGRYSHAELSEKAAAVDAIPLGGGEGEAVLSRPQLEAFAALAVALLGSVLFTPPFTPATDSAVDSVRPPETDPGKKGTRKRRVKR